MRERERGDVEVGAKRSSDRARVRHPAVSLVDRVGNRGILRRLRRDDGKVAADAAQRARDAPAAALPHRAHAEAALGLDLSNIHAVTGPSAEQACAAVGASAFTVGNVVAFARRDPDPATVVHEATHAVQQRMATTSPFPTRLPVVERHDAQEHEADIRERGGVATPTRAPGLVLAMKPGPGQTGVTKGSIPLLAEPGGPAVAHLSPGTQVNVVSMIGPAYEVNVVDGPDAGKHGVLPSYALDDAPAPSLAKSASSGRDPSVLTDSSLQSELDASDGWLVDHPLDIKRSEMEGYNLALRAEWSKRHPAGAAAPPPQKITIATPLIVPLDAAPGTLKLVEGANGLTFVPNGAAVMGSEFFGGQSWVFSSHAKRELPIPWNLGVGVRGIAAEPMITNEFYQFLNPEVLPRGFPAADISFGGSYAPIEGYSWLKNGTGKSVKTPWVGWEIEAPSIVGYKTIDVSQYSTPGSLESALDGYVTALATPTSLGKTDVEKVPGMPRIRIQIENPTDRILHLQLSGEPDPVQASEIASIKERAASVGVKVVVMGPPTNYGKSTVITTGNLPGVGYINTTPPLTVDPKFESRQALGAGSLLLASVVFGAANYFGDKIQQEDAQKALDQALAQVREIQKTQPETGATIWVTWYPSGAPDFSVNQPGPQFGGVQIVFEREPSDSAPPGLYKNNGIGGFINKPIWIPRSRSNQSRPRTLQRSRSATTTRSPGSSVSRRMSSSTRMKAVSSARGLAGLATSTETCSTRRALWSPMRSLRSRRAGCPMRKKSCIRRASCFAQMRRL